ncbi:hypothetical protein [Mameliella sediminis]|uniref:hypothetical protein n=1 Tax=Mameliella sediminis TaxID=2836866 RepID=UPI001C47D7E5|nr:hypothetical protein [Mameliella sediminis]MBY6117374.1 hypothetical protein [Antarctobacter heliothermus]MBY6147230.1 hypothetical protein [Mameliella alba]MBV7397426.1 hypothetical protein [Mameliella sediminis]MBY6164106.1 hypothetical protein [Mameliella alba]MBY6172611.1 hypothetical protein [Mameliella alba]
MTRFLTATALATVVATGAVAQSQVDVSTIEKFLPRVKAETLTELQVTQLVAIAHGSESASDKKLQMRALVTDANLEPLDPLVINVSQELTEYERTQIERYAPELDVDTLTESEIQSLQIAINNGDNSDIDTVVRRIMAN